MPLNPETPLPPKKPKCDDKGVNTDTPAFEFNNDLSHPPNPSHKFEAVRWNPLIVHESMVEETIIRELEKKVSEKLDKLFPELLGKHFLTMDDEWIDRVVDKIIQSSGIKFFHFFMDEQLKFFQEIGEKLDVEYVDDCESDKEEGEILEGEEE